MERRPWNGPKTAPHLLSLTPQRGRKYLVPTALPLQQRVFRWWDAHLVKAPGPEKARRGHQALDEAPTPSKVDPKAAPDRLH